MTTNEEILRKECVFTSNWKLEKHRNGITECTYAFLDKIMSLARQEGAKDERERILVCTGCKKSIEKSCIIYGIHCNSCENKYHTITYEKGKKDTEEHRDWCIKMHIDNSLEHKDCSFCKLKQAGRNEVEKELIGLSANEMAKRQAEKIAALEAQLSLCQDVARSKNLMDVKKIGVMATKKCGEENARLRAHLIWLDDFIVNEGVLIHLCGKEGSEEEYTEEDCAKCKYERAKKALGGKS